MKLSIETIERTRDEEILIRCHEMNNEIRSYIDYFNTKDAQLIGYIGNTMHRISLSDVYYFEAVDHKVFIYCSHQVYEARQKLYDLEEMTKAHHFFRSSRTVITNLDRIQMVKPYLGGRFEALLDNNEKLIISRQYVPVLKEMLGV